MREIKFRIYGRDAERMFGPYDLDGIQKHVSYPLGWGEVMQYTGLKDKNGTEIYIGDYLSDGESIGVIQEMDEFIGSEGIVMGGWVFKTTSICPEISKYFEVIGNIYENPELLEK